MRRVVITGMGAISALGRNAPEFWSALSKGRSGIRPIETVDRTKLRFQNGAEVHGYRPAKILRDEANRLHRPIRAIRSDRRARGDRRRRH